ncbi:MAG TPA: O-antigen ligase family protein, partial [Candidatus Saccharimonadales bacterium]|nr:O-antigen ligase family protein [Candidatus Saccharimonadales bacterium]
MNQRFTPFKPAKVLAFGIIFILILLPLHAVLTTWLGSNFGHLDLFRIWKEMLLVPLTIGAAAIAYQDKQIKNWLLNSKLVRLILAYILLHFVLGIWAVYDGSVSRTALIYSLLINLRFLVFFLVCIVVAAKTSILGKNWKNLILWPAAVVVLFGLAQKFLLPSDFLRHFGYGPKTIPAIQTIDQKPDYIRIQSTLRGANPLGAYLVLIITILAAYLVKLKKHWQTSKELRIVLLILMSVVVLFFTYSRSAWLGAVLSIGFLALLLFNNPKKRQLTLLVTAAVTTVAVGLVFSLRNNNLLQNTLFHTDETSHSAESSNTVRTQAMLDGAKSVIKRPLGSGPGTAGPASFRNSGHKARISENYFIQIGQEVGILGLLIFLAINLVVAKELWKLRPEILPTV